MRLGSELVQLEPLRFLKSMRASFGFGVFQGTLSSVASVADMTSLRYLQHTRQRPRVAGDYGLCGQPVTS